MKQDNEIHALITLLEDDDKEVLEHVSEKLFSYGASVIPNLEDAWELSYEPEKQNRIENLIRRIQYDLLCSDLVQWGKSEPHNLVEGALIIDRYLYPNLDPEEIKYQISRIKKEIWIELSEQLTPLEEIHVFNQVLYKFLGFQGPKKTMAEPESCYLSNLVKTKKGNPISLGILYLSIAQELDIPLYGVQLPYHFVMARLSDDLLLGLPGKQDVIFYVDAFNEGVVFREKDIRHYLSRFDKAPLDKYFQPVDNLKVIRILLSFLKRAYEHKQDYMRAGEMEHLRGLLRY